MVRARARVFVRIAPYLLLSLLVYGPQALTGSSHTAANYTVQGPGMASDDAALFGVHEITLASGNAAVDNPHDTDLRVVFTPPSGTAVTVNGFHDGGTTWSARVYVTEVGSWTWSSSSTDDAGLDKQSGSFTAVSSGLRGKLRKHPQHNQRWATEDGRFFLAMADTPYVLFNDECSAWFNPACTEDLFHRYVAQIATRGVSLLRVGYGGGYADWNPAARAVDGRYPKANWIHDGWDYSRFDLSQLRKSDERLAWLLNHYPEVYVDLHLLPKANDPGLHWFEDLTEVERQRTMKVLVARLAAFPNVLFLIQRDIRHNYSPGDKITLNEPNLEMCRQVGAYLAENDPWDTLRGCNEKPREYNQLTTPTDFETWASYLEVQHLGYPHASAVDWYYENPDHLPVHVFHGEDTYEKPWAGRPRDPAYYYRRMFWSTLLSGGSAAYGSQYKTTIPYDETGSTDYWSTDGLASPYRTQLTGLDEVIHIRTFFEQHNIDLADFTPDDQVGRLEHSVAPEGNAGPGKIQAARDGTSRYLFYHPNAADGELESPDITLETGERVETRYNASLQAGRTPGIIVDLGAATGRVYDAAWFHPVTGQSYAGGMVSGGASVTMTAPAAFSGSDAVLFLRARAQTAPQATAFVTAHRGGGSGANGWGPENTMANFRKCMANGVNIETDLNYTSDGAIILMHGGELATTTNGSGAPTAQTLAYVQGLDAAAHGGWRAEYSPQPVPLLEQLLDEFRSEARPGTVIVADVHRLKPNPAMTVQLLQALDHKRLFDRVHIQVYDLAHAQALRSAADSLLGGHQMLKLAIWVDNDEALFEQAVHSGYFIQIDADSALTPRALNLPDGILFIGGAADWNRPGVDGITTDYVDQSLLAIEGSIPEVVLKEPATGTQAASDVIDIEVDYGDSDGSITRVDFYAGPDLLESDTTPPYTHSWTPPVAGTYVLTARVFDNGKEKTSPPVTVTYQ